MRNIIENSKNKWSNQYAISRDNITYEVVKTIRFGFLAAILMPIALLCTVFINHYVIASGLEADYHGFFSMLESDVLVGNIDLVNFFGKPVVYITQVCLSLGGIVAISCKTSTAVFSIVYLSAPRFFDHIHDARVQNGVSLSQISKTASDIIHGQGGSTGMLFYTLGLLMLDFKELSDFANDNVSDYDTIGQVTIGTYIKSNIFEFSLIVVFSALLFSGQSLKIVANLSKGCLVFTEKLTTYDISGKVKSILEADADYQFIFAGSSTSNAPINQMNYAKMLYSAVKDAYPYNTEEFNTAIGEAIKQSAIYIGVFPADENGNLTEDGNIELSATQVDKEGNPITPEGTYKIKAETSSDVITYDSYLSSLDSGYATIASAMAFARHSKTNKYEDNPNYKVVPKGWENKGISYQIVRTNKCPPPSEIAMSAGIVFVPERFILQNTVASGKAKGGYLIKFVGSNSANMFDNSANSLDDGVKVNGAIEDRGDNNLNSSNGATNPSTE